MRKNLSILITIGVFIAFLIPGIMAYKEAEQSLKRTISYQNMVKEKCIEGEYPAYFCVDFFDDENNWYEYYMQNISLGYIYKTVSFVIIAYSLFPFLIPWLVLRPRLKSKQIENQMLRKSYKDICLEFLKESYKVIWIVPFIFLALYFIAFARILPLEYTPLRAFLAYLPNVLCHLLIISININFALILMRFCHKFFSYLFIGGFSYISVALLLNELSYYLRHSKHLNNFMDIAYPYFEKINITELWSLGLLFLISWGLLYLAYRNKEKLVIACEKNH